MDGEFAAETGDGEYGRDDPTGGRRSRRRGVDSDPRAGGKRDRTVVTGRGVSGILVFSDLKR